MSGKTPDVEENSYMFVFSLQLPDINQIQYMSAFSARNVR